MAEDTLLPTIIAFLKEKGKIKASTLQREFKLGYCRAHRIIDQLDEKGLLEGEKGTYHLYRNFNLNAS